MLIALYLLLGVVFAVISSRLVVLLTSENRALEDEEPGNESVELHIWQQGRWPLRIRLGLLAFLPLLMALTAVRFSPGEALVVSVFLAGLLICTVTDLLRFRVPNALTYPGIVLALVAAVVMPDSDVEGALIATLLAAVVFFMLAVITRGGMGLGDVKLAALIGAFLGLPGAVQALALGVLAAGVLILPLFLFGVLGRKDPIPYAPFLALAAIAIALTKGTSFAQL
jgi:prepilin signal peptidase PulO-like enzyme (type II secretory pathway)